MPPAASRDYTRLLDAVIDVGAALVERLRNEPVRPGQEVARDYDLISRALRRSVLLVRKLAEDPEAVQAQRRAQERCKHRVGARKRILREVEDAIQRRVGEPEAGHLRAELVERIDLPELEDEIDARPIPAIIADIIHDLGVVDPLTRQYWQRRSPSDVQHLCALANRHRAEPAAPRPRYQDDPICTEQSDDVGQLAGACVTLLRQQALVRDRA